MPKPNPLSQGLEQNTASRLVVAAPAVQPSVIPKAVVAPSRTGRVLIGGHFAPEVQRALKIIAAEEGTTIQALLAEALNTVFAKRQKPEIAEFTAN
jgi:hypothetical protein